MSSTDRERREVTNAFERRRDANRNFESRARVGVETSGRRFGFRDGGKRADCQVTRGNRRVDETVRNGRERRRRRERRRKFRWLREKPLSSSSQSSSGGRRR